MTDFMQDLERKVVKMKGESETAAEELIALRGRHLELKKRRQCLSQQVAHCIQVSCKQEQTVLKTQEEINELMRRCQSTSTTVSSSLLSPSVPLDATPQHIMQPSNASSNGFHLYPSLNLHPLDIQHPLSMGMSQTSGCDGMGHGMSTPWSAPALHHTVSEGHEGWLEGSSLRGLLADAFEDPDQEQLSLTDLFSEDTEQPAAARHTKKSRT